MREVIQKVIAAEAEATELLKTAKAEAEALIRQARVDALQKTEQSHREAQVEADRLIAEAEANAIEAQRQSIEQYVRDLQATIRLDDEAHRRAVQAVVDTVLGST